MLYAIGYPVPERHWHLGRDHPDRLGLRHRQLRVVDRHRPRRHADLRHSSSAAPVVAQFHQPFRRSHDAVRRGLRRNLSRHPRRASVAGVLAVSLSQHHGRVAAIPQPAHVGRVRRLHLRHDLRVVLVHRPDSRPGHAARSRDQSRGQNHLRHALDGLARIGAALAPLRNGLPAARRTGHAAGALGPHRGELRLRRSASSPAGTPRSSRPTSLPAPSTPDSPWC